MASHMSTDGGLSRAPAARLRLRRHLRGGGARKFLFSGLGALAWSATVGSAAYVLGQRMEALSTRANLVIGTFVLLAALARLRFLTRNRARLQIEADRSGG
jgi:hypothetical protein